MTSHDSEPKTRLSKQGVTLNLSLAVIPIIQLALALIATYWGGLTLWQAAQDITNTRPPLAAVLALFLAAVILAVDWERLAEALAARKKRPTEAGQEAPGP